MQRLMQLKFFAEIKIFHFYFITIPRRRKRRILIRIKCFWFKGFLIYHFQSIRKKSNLIGEYLSSLHIFTLSFENHIKVCKNHLSENYFAKKKKNLQIILLAFFLRVVKKSWDEIEEKQKIISYLINVIVLQMFSSTLWRSLKVFSLIIKSSLLKENFNKRFFFFLARLRNAMKREIFTEGRNERNDCLAYKEYNKNYECIGVKANKKNPRHTACEKKFFFFFWIILWFLCVSRVSVCGLSWFIFCLHNL